MHQPLIRPLDASLTRVAWAVIASIALMLSLVLTATPVRAGLQLDGQVDLTIVKMDENGNLLPGVTFSLDGGAGVTTDGFGGAFFDNVDTDFETDTVLTLEETGNENDQCDDPEDNVLGDLEVTVTAADVVTVTDLTDTDNLDVQGVAGTTITVVNTCGDDSSIITDEVTFDLTIVKEDQDGGLLDDVTFSLDGDLATTGEDGEGNAIFEDITLDLLADAQLDLSEISNENEECDDNDVLGDLTIDVTSVTELDVTDNDESDDLMIDAVSGTTITIVNECGGGDLEIIKTDDEGNLLGDVEFNLSGNGDSTIDLDEITNDDGSAIFENVELDSSFTLTETSGSDECAQDEETSLTIDVSIDGVITLTDEDDEDSLDIDLDSDLGVDLDLGLLDDEDALIVLVNECTESGTGAGGGSATPSTVPDTAIGAPSVPAGPLALLISMLVLIASAGTLLTLRSARRP